MHPNKTVVGSSSDFNPRKVQLKPDDIPYRSLAPQSMENLLVARRSRSDTRVAQVSACVTATAMAMGEAAEVAAADSLREQISVAENNRLNVHEKFNSQNAGPFTDT